VANRPVIRQGDIVTCEISAAAAPEYPGRILRTFTVGAPPTTLYRELHAAASTAFEAIAHALIPGARRHGAMRVGSGSRTWHW
jgi:Xaa-Pro dipeptidase